jgi:RNA polymerase sigma factor for flagellar operon FliA
MDADVRNLWTAFHEEGDETARARIVERNLPLVRHVAGRVRRSMGRHLELDELVNAGCLGLLNAVDNFDPSRRLAFSTYAVPRIRGAILDDLRRSDHSTRAGRRRRRQIADAERAVANGTSAAPGSLATAGQLEIDVDTLWRWKARARQTVPLSLDGPARADLDGGPTMGELIPDSSAPDIEHCINLKEEVRLLRDVVLELPERERLVLFLYYHEELKLRQIAEILRLTESRISQIRSSAIRTLRSRIATLRGPQ